MSNVKTGINRDEGDEIRFSLQRSMFNVKKQFKIKKIDFKEREIPESRGYNGCHCAVLRCQIPWFKLKTWNPKLGTLSGFPSIRHLNSLIYMGIPGAVVWRFEGFRRTSDARLD